MKPSGQKTVYPMLFKRLTWTSVLCPTCQEVRLLIRIMVTTVLPADTLLVSGAHLAPPCAEQKGRARSALGWHFRPSPPRLAPLRHGKMYRRITRG